MRMYRQGDVLIVEAKRDLRYARRASDNVLVYGEATGHAHRVDGDAAVVMDTPQGKVIDASASFRVIHEEHDTLDIPAGCYRVVRQREYDEQVIRHVVD